MSEFTAKGEISKVDDEKKQVFGWASVTDLDGEPVTDRQNDWVATEDLEKAAYDYVLSSRVGGTMHERMEKKSKPKPTSTMIESFVVTPEKIEKMGLPEGSLPLGWWMGFQINDDQTWDRVKKGKLGSFSIHGAGRRKQVDKADIRKAYESTLAQVWKACEGDQVLFTKAIAHLTDEAYDRGHGDAHFYEQVLKHLIGSHDQSSHGRDEHGQSEKATAAGLASGGFGAAAGGVLGGLATRSSTGAAIGSAIGGGTFGGAGWLGTKLSPGQEANDLEGAAREMDEVGNKEEADRLRREAKRKREESQETSKHLIGSHEQKDHDPRTGKETRQFHSREEHEGLFPSGTKAKRRNEMKARGGDLIDPDNFRSMEGLRRQKTHLQERKKEAQQRGEPTRPYDKAMETVDSALEDPPWKRVGKSCLSDREKQILTKFLGS